MLDTSVAQLHFDFEQQEAAKGKGGSPSLLRRNRAVLRVLFRRSKICLTMEAQR